MSLVVPTVTVKLINDGGKIRNGRRESVSKRKRTS